MQLAKHIVLVGPMGVGKTSIGRALSRKLTAELIDTDSYLEKTVAPISWIMDKEGDDGFRMYENRCLREIFERFGAAEPIIVATGGGVVLRTENRAFLTQAIDATVIYLKASAPLLASRSLQTKSRPALAKADNTLDFFTSMLDQREGFYNEVADLVFDVADYHNPQTLVKHILPHVAY